MAEEGREGDMEGGGEEEEVDVGCEMNRLGMDEIMASRSSWNCRWDGASFARSKPVKE